MQQREVVVARVVVEGAAGARTEMGVDVGNMRLAVLAGRAAPLLYVHQPGVHLQCVHEHY